MPKQQSHKVSPRHHVREESGLIVSDLARCHFFNKASISNLVLKQNMEVIKVKPMWFDAFYVSMLSEKYKFGKMKVIKGFCVGLLSNIKAFSSKEGSSLIYIIKNN